MKQPKTTSEHIIALYGHIKGLKSAICSIRNNDLKHIHGDIDRLHSKNRQTPMVDHRGTRCNNAYYCKRINIRR